MYGESKKTINQTQDYDDDGIEQKKIPTFAADFKFKALCQTL